MSHQQTSVLGLLRVARIRNPKDGEVQVLLELLLQVVAEAIGELGIKALRQIVRPSHPARPVLAGIGYCVLGVCLGAASAWAFPARLAHSTGYRLVILAIVPALSAACLWSFLTFIHRPEAAQDRRRRFWLAYGFGLAFALMRFSLAK